MYESLKLVTDDGCNISITYPEDIQEQIWDELKEHLESKQLWWISNWCDVTVKYKNRNLEYINMTKIIGIDY